MIRPQTNATRLLSLLLLLHRLGTVQVEPQQAAVATAQAKELSERRASSVDAMRHMTAVDSLATPFSS